ncbi:nose resistant to fluoxetine protein 6-like isoform X3 [Diabrotica undecimpunctata]
MNGGRVFGMLIIILIHVGVANNTSFISEPEIYEHVYHIIVDSILGCLPVLIVLYFFLISSWLLTIQMYNIHEKGQLSLKTVGILIINRYFRLNCTIIVFMILSRTSWITIIPGPANFYSVIANQKACSENWFPSILFFVNFYQAAHICNPITSHVSVDFQLYVINLFLLYIKLKFNFNTIKFFATMLTFSLILHGITLQIFDTGPLYLASLRYLEVRSIYHSLLYVVAYMSTSTLWSSSLIGVIFGIIYIKTKNLTIKPNTVLNIIWCSTSVGLIYLAIKMGSIKIIGTKASLLGCIIRPIFSLGCALGVYGMSHNLGGPIKKLMESKLFVVLSNCLYCVYLVHCPCILMINRFNLEPIYFDVWKMFQDYVLSVILSFLIGIYFTLAVEEPGNMIQKIILPQINKWKKISKIK